MGFQVVGQIQQRLPEYVAFTQKQCDEQSTYTAVPVQKRMDGFKLRMRKRCMDKYRKMIPFVKKILEFVQGDLHVMRTWRYELCFGECAAGWANPVLGCTKVPGLPILPSNSGQKSPMNLTKQAKGEGQRVKAMQPMLHGGYVIDHLLNITWLICCGTVGLILQNIFQRTLSTLDLGTQYGLLADIHGDEEIRVWQYGCYSIQSAKYSVSVRQQTGEALVHSDGRSWWQGSRDERAVRGRSE